MNVKSVMRQSNVAQNRSSIEPTHQSKQTIVTHPHKAAAHVGISYREVGFGDGFLKDEVNDTLEPFFCVYAELRHLLHQLLEHLWRELVKDAAHTAEQLLCFCSLSVIFFLLYPTASGLLLDRRCPSVLSLVEFHIVFNRHAGDDLGVAIDLVFASTRLRAPCRLRRVLLKINDQSQNTATLLITDN